MNLPKLTFKKIFGPRFQKTLFVYFPLNFFFVIFLICGTHKISRFKVPESFILKLIAKKLYIILPWAYFYSHILYSRHDTLPKERSTIPEKDIELGPVAPLPKPLDAPIPLPAEFVEIDLGEGPSNCGLPGPPRPFLTCEV